MGNALKGLCVLLIALQSCKQHSEENLLTSYAATTAEGSVNAVIEIPSGTRQKWEINKKTGVLEWEQVAGKGRIVEYLGYPGNYGFIPKTLLPKDQGGDGDPLDVLVLGDPVSRGSVVPCKLIGVLHLQDRGEHDDKLIAVAKNTSFYAINTIEDLNENYPGVTTIIETWFTNYKGKGLMKSSGYGDAAAATQVLNEAIQGFENQ